MNHVWAGRTMEYYSVKVVPLTACAPYPIKSGIYSCFFFLTLIETRCLRKLFIRGFVAFCGEGELIGCMTMMLLIPLGNNLTSEFHILLKHIIWRWFCRWVLISITLCIIIFITPTFVFCFLTSTHSSVSRLLPPLSPVFFSNNRCPTGKGFPLTWSLWV